MNSKGFTLVELLGVVVILAILVGIITPSILKSLNNGKQTSYDILIENIIVASKSYYEECKYGNLKDNVGNKRNCDSSITLGELVNLGFLKGTNEKVCDVDGNNCKTKLVIKNPKTDDDISTCEIKININKNDEKTIYVVKSLKNINICPDNIEEYNGDKVLGSIN